MFENPRGGRQARNFTTNAPKILDLKSFSEQILSKNWPWVPLVSVDSVMFWQKSLKLVLHYLGFHSWAQVFLSFSITLIIGVILCKDNNGIAHFKPTFLASGSDNSVYILFSQFIQEQNAAKSCQIKQDLHSLTSFISDKKDYITPGAHQMEPPSPLISWLNPFPSRFINRTACFPRKVSYFRESRMSPWKKWSWMKSNSEARPSTVFLFYYTSIFTVLQPLGSGMK